MKLAHSENREYKEYKESSFGDTCSTEQLSEKHCVEQNMSGFDENVITDQGYDVIGEDGEVCDRVKFNFSVQDIDAVIIKLDDNVEKDKEKKADLLVLRKMLVENNINYFSYFEKKYKVMLKGTIRKVIKLRDEDEIEELLQTTLVKVYRGLGSYKLEYAFSSWIYKIASNNCIDYLRKKKLNTFSIDSVVSKEGEEGKYEIPDNSYVPDSNILNSESQNALQFAISQLPDNYKKIIHLRHTEDMEYAEIAELLNLPLGTVKAHLFRARKLLYQSLKDKRYLFDKE